MLSLFLFGCGKPTPSTKTTATDDKEKPLPSQTVNVPNGSSTQYDPTAPKREPQWFVQWKQAKIDVGGGYAAMDGVSGELYGYDEKDRQHKNRQVTTYRAQSGLADKGKQILMLSGEVHVVSADPKAELTCDRMIYDAKTERIRAMGHVKVVGEVGTIGTLSELWATKDLKTVGTPDMFNAR